MVDFFSLNMDLMLGKIQKVFRILYDDLNARQASQTPTSNGTLAFPASHVPHLHKEEPHPPGG